MIKFFIVTGILILYILLMIFIMGKLNLSRSERFRQAGFLLVMTIYVAAISLCFFAVLVLTDEILSIGAITRIVLEGVPSECYGAAFMLMIMLLSNAMVLTGADLILVLWKRRFASSDPDSSYRLMLWLEGFTARFYETKGGKEPVFLKKQYKVTAYWLDVMRKAIIVIFLAVAILSLFSIYIPVLTNGRLLILVLKYSYILMAATYILIAQLYYFLDGITEEEQMSEFESDPVTSVRKGSYDRLLEVYQKKFPDAILNKDQYWIETEKIAENMFNDISRTQVERCKNGDVFELVMESVKRHCVKLATSYVEAMLALVDNKSVLIKDSIFGEFAIYFASYLDYQLSAGKKAIVIAADRSRIDDIISVLRKNFKTINDINPVWRIVSADDFQDGKDADVLVCCDKDLDPIEENEFFRNARCIVVDDPDSNYASGTIMKRIIHSRLSSVVLESKIQYIYMCDESNRNLEESIEHTIGQPVAAYQNTLIDKRMCVIVWKGEPYTRMQERLNLRGAYMGTAYPLAAVAVRYGVRNIGIWCPDNVPYMTYREIMNDNSDFLKQHLIKDANINMNEIVHINDVRDYESGPLKFLILYDEANNLIALLHNWLKYGGEESTMLHVVSRPYMLREYFAENLRTLLKTPSEVKRLIPYKGCDIQRQKEILLIGLYEGQEGKPDYEVIEMLGEFSHFGYGEDDIECYLYRLLSSVCPESGIRPESVYDYFSVEPKKKLEIAEGKYQFRSYNEIKFIDTESYHAIIEKYSFGRIRHGGTDTLETISIHSEDLYNYYLPMQIHCFNGELYRIEEISKGEILLKKTSPKNVPEYKVVDNCEANITERSETYTLEDKFTVTEIRADVRKTIRAYYELSDGNNFKEKTFVTEALSDNVESGTGTYSKVIFSKPVVIERTEKQGIELQLNVPGRNKEKTELLLAAMFNEILKTIYPDNYKDIIVCVERSEALKSICNELTEEESRVAETIPMVQFEKESGNTMPTVYIFEMSYLEKGLINELSSKENIENIFDIMYNYLNWELRKENGNSYLKYGLADYPAMFDVKEFLACLENLRLRSGKTHEYEESGEDETLEGISICPYCGREILVEFNMTSDGKFMCDNCANSIVSSRREIEKVYKKAKTQMEEYYHIELPRIKAFRFKGSDEIKKAAGNRYTVGFYSSSKKEIWVERYVPETYMIGVLVHELTHSWQFENLNGTVLSSLEIVEGHAKYVEIETLRKLREERYADYQEKCLPLIEGNSENPYYKGYYRVKALIENSTEKNVFRVIKKLESEKSALNESEPGGEKNEE